MGIAVLTVDFRKLSGPEPADEMALQAEEMSHCVQAMKILVISILYLDSEAMTSK